MKRTMVALLAILLASIVVVYLTERSAEHARIARNPFVWFVAVKHWPESPQIKLFNDSTRLEWRSRADSVLVGDAPYWDEFFVLGGHDPTAHPTLPGNLADAFVIRIEPVRLPLLLSGTFSMLHRLGIWRMPTGDVGEGVLETHIATGLGPSRENVATLLSRPSEQQPAMVNFLRYSAQAHYADSDDEAPVTGREAYARYGSVAFRTVYSVGGELVTTGKVVEIVKHPTAGPTRGEWDDIAIMQYPSQQAILTMEQVADYRASLAHRNAGLERTRVVASLAF